MNYWKPLALVSTAGLIFLVGSQAAHADARPNDNDAHSVQNQPNMQASLSKLREARAFLDKAEHDKGGWRTAAIQSTDTAIKETERGIAFGDH